MNNLALSRMVKLSTGGCHTFMLPTVVGAAMRTKRFIRPDSGKYYSLQSKSKSRRDKPFRLAVIGSGPAGFYTASRAMALIDTAVIDMYESLPTPFGLVRYGIAPDHWEVAVSFPGFVI
jgi:hypothetical protein